MAQKFKTKSEQQMRQEITFVIENLTTLMHWNREMAIEEQRPIFNTIGNILFENIEKLNKV